MTLLGMIQTKIQTGSTTVTTGGTAVNVTVTDVTNIKRCIIITSTKTAGSCTATLTTATNLSVNHSATGGVVDWQIIEMGGASV